MVYPFWFIPIPLQKATPKGIILKWVCVCFFKRLLLRKSILILSFLAFRAGTGVSLSFRGLLLRKSILIPFLFDFLNRDEYN
jgi:hypothetical protein